ncbi:Sec-independent protein translocase protein TatB [Agaribacter flavus]|uniref:Sec-independent protein translocase protein TatB n=1 Tax=Agaribacter flavus TaxID=1902781 RepID=A0ABV7FSD4_9ALTE
MFDIGFWELLVIGVIALVVLGPERLPGAIRSTMETVRSIKNVANGFKQEVSYQLKTHELHEHLKKAEKEGLGQVGDDVKQSIEELKSAAASVQRPYENSILPSENSSESENKK